MSEQDDTDPFTENALVMIAEESVRLGRPATLSDVLKRRREERVEREAIIVLLTASAGYGICVEPSLHAYRLEDGRFAVLNEARNLEGPRDGEQLFEDPGEAADAFLTERRDCQLGFDYEIALNSKGTQ